MFEFFEKNLAFLIIATIVGSYVAYDAIKERKAAEKKEQELKDAQKNTEEIKKNEGKETQGKTEESQKREEK